MFLEGASGRADVVDHPLEGSLLRRGTDSSTQRAAIHHGDILAHLKRVLKEWGG